MTDHAIRTMNYNQALIRMHAACIEAIQNGWVFDWVKPVLGGWICVKKS